MIPIKVTVLGSNSAIPAHGRHPTAQWIHLDGFNVLMDCGEGTQIRVQKSDYTPRQMDAICISHLHGDHVFGLPGMMTTMSLLGRTKMLNIFGPVGLNEMLETMFRLSGSRFTYPWAVHEHDAKSLHRFFENDICSIDAFPLNHRSPTNGYLFTLKERMRRLKGELVEKNGVPYDARSVLKSGEDYKSPSGEVYKWEDYTLPGDRSRTYAFCSDTLFDPSLGRYIIQPDGLYHEATYLSDMAEQARERYHSTANEAAQMARELEAKLLLIGHASSRYRNTSLLENEAREVFPNTHYVQELKTYEI